MGYVTPDLFRRLDAETLVKCGVTMLAHVAVIVELVERQRVDDYEVFVSHSKGVSGPEAAMIGDYIRARLARGRVFVDTEELKELDKMLPAAKD